jgi:hypothetical protein
MGFLPNTLLERAFYLRAQPQPGKEFPDSLEKNFSMTEKGFQLPIKFEARVLSFREL